MSTKSSTYLRRTGALATAAALAASTVLIPAAVSAADEPVLPGVTLPSTAVDVTSTDADLGSVAREVVVSVDTPTGTQIRKFRVRSQEGAQALTAELDALPGVAASVNVAFSIPDADLSAVGEATSSSAAAAAAGTLRTAATVAPLSMEQYGADQWGLYAVNAEGAWPMTRGQGVVVALVDTGVDATHPDLATRLLPQVDLVGDSLTGDPNGHGTHLAGIIAASLDGAGVAGVANRVQILPIRVADATGAADAYTLAAGIRHAADAGAKVINVSLCGYLDPVPDGGVADPALAAQQAVVGSAVQDALSKGVTVVAAGGNDGEGANRVAFPAVFDGVLGVSALGLDLGHFALASTGSYIDITAPGEAILSTFPATVPLDELGSTSPWVFADGTSASAAFVSGTAALVRAANPHFSAAKVASTLTSTALDLPLGAADGRDDVYGAGLLQADRATRAAAYAPYGVRAPAVTVQVKAVTSASKLWVNVNPNKGSGYWTFRVQRKRSDGTWATLSTLYKTSGSTETRTIDLKKGTYRVKVYAKYGYKGATSAKVTLKR